MINTLFYGDNLEVLRRHIRDGSVDLVYLDPPFKSDVNYNVLFHAHGTKSVAQIEAFEDTWEWNTEAAAAYQEVVEAGGEVANAMRSFRTLLGTSDMLAYLSMMAPRLTELHRVLKPTGSLYLHCDPTASHYLKLLLDAIFGPEHFRAEIIWERAGAHNMRVKGWARVNDSLLFFTKSDAFTFNAQYTAYGAAQMSRFKVDASGRLYKAENLTFSTTSPGRQFEWRGTRPPANRSWGATLEQLEAWLAEGRILLKRDGTPRMDGLKIYLDDTTGKPLGTNWTDIPRIPNTSRERLGYPTQKPLALLERIISASSNAGDVVLDPFCGCGTAIDAAQALGRAWIGIDITHLAVGLIKHRLSDRYGPEIAKAYRVIGEPTTVEDAEVLAREDPFQFQAWALGLVGARVATSDRRGGDKGVDGRLYFHDSPSGPTRQIVFSVKAGHLVPAYVRELEAVRQQQGADLGILISFVTPTPGMLGEAAGFGFYESPWGKHQRIQLRTVGQLLDGKGIDYPHIAGANVTHKKAAKVGVAPAQTLELFGEG
jgi:site-specific DNA-methyltransferase (adenine-specific)